MSKEITSRLNWEENQTLTKRLVIHKVKHLSNLAKMAAYESIKSVICTFLISEVDLVNKVQPKEESRTRNRARLCTSFSIKKCNKESIVQCTGYVFSRGLDCTKTR